MIRYYPLTLNHEKFLTHGLIGIYPLQYKIAYIHTAVCAIPQKESGKEPSIICYVLMDTFSENFSVHNQFYIPYYGKSIIFNAHASCYWDKGCLMLNTTRYNISNYIGLDNCIAKIIKISDTELTEIGDSPAPIPCINNDSKIYTFRNFDISMASYFTMVCKRHNSEEIIWKVKLSAYLYTEIEERDGIVYFGTAGKGGRFYGVSFADGSIIFNYNTGGTVKFLWYEELILLSDRRYKPVLLNPKDGTEVKKIDFGKFRFTYDQNMYIKDQWLYAEATREDMLYAVCVNLQE